MERLFAPSLIELVDFKWLMAGQGWRVHLERMQSDPAYARWCLAAALRSDNELLRSAARKLERELP